MGWPRVSLLVALLLNLTLSAARVSSLFVLWAEFCERQFNAATGRAWRSHGVSAWLLAAAPVLALCYGLLQVPYVTWLVEGFLLWMMLDLTSVQRRFTRICQALRLGDSLGAKQALSPLVAHQLDERELAKTSLEALLRIGGQLVAVLFWFAVFGVMGAVLYRVAARLNRLWGHRDARFIRFGWASAMLFKALDWLPARLCALTYALLGNTGQALTSWRSFAKHWPSPNAGALIAAGAGALDVRLGGPAHYTHFCEPRVWLGGSRAASATLVEQGLNLVYLSLFLWLLLITVACALGVM